MDEKEYYNALTEEDKELYRKFMETYRHRDREGRKRLLDEIYKLIFDEGDKGDAISTDDVSETVGGSFIRVTAELEVRGVEKKEDE